MNEKETLDLIISLGEGVWKNWGFIITINLAVIGWLLQRHGLYSRSEKIVSTLGYTVFVVTMVGGMDTSYKKLDAAANELAYKYTLSVNERLVATPGGIVQYYISKSPDFCQEVSKRHAGIKKCKKYSCNMMLPAVSLSVSWLFFIFLFWNERVWFKARASAKKE